MSYNCCNKVPQAQFLKLFFCLFWVFIAVPAFSSCGATASHCDGFPCCGAWALGSMGFSSCGTQAQYLQLPGSRAQAQQLCSGLVALQHVGSSKTRVSKLCLLYQQAISSHFTTREVLKLITLKHLLEFWRSESGMGMGGKAGSFCRLQKRIHFLAFSSFHMLPEVNGWWSCITLISATIVTSPSLSLSDLPASHQ